MTAVADDGSLKILERRARELAKPEVQTGMGGGVPAVTFELCGERYAVEVAHVREIRRLNGLTPVPGVPAFVLGLINLRGEILSVLDLRRILGLPSPSLGTLARVLVLSSPAMTFGLAVDRLKGTEAIPIKTLQPPPTSREGPGKRIVKGVTRDRVVFLDGGALLSEPSLVVG